jgi:hypothetical protein
MKNYEIKSVLSQIATEVFTMRDINQAKTYISEFLADKGINGIDKNIIINGVGKCSNIPALQRYICNSLLKYEGMGLS